MCGIVRYDVRLTRTSPKGDHTQAPRGGVGADDAGDMIGVRRRRVVGGGGSKGDEQKDEEAAEVIMRRHHRCAPG